MRIPLRRRKALTTVPSQPSFGKRFLGILAHQGDHGLNERHQAEEHREQEGRADNPPVSRGSQQGSRANQTRVWSCPDNGRRRQARAGRRCRSRGHRDNPHSTTKLKATLRRPTPIVLSRPSSPIRLDTSDENRPANARAAKSTMAARNARVIDSNTTSWDVTLAIRSEVHTAAAPGTCSIMAAATAEGCAPSFTFTITHEIASKGSTLSQTLSRTDFRPQWFAQHSHP